MVDFIGIGAQKSGTSWVYACLYEHPQVCAPMKEIHFFSRPRFEEGREWYEKHFSSCGEGKLRGEFSTSYLYSKEAPLRIKSFYPNVKLIAILRNPVDRAYSQYRNAIKAGEIPETQSFDAYAQSEASVFEQGMYAEQLARYRAHFPKEQLLVMVYEDIASDPQAFMKRIYSFLGVDATFVPSMLHARVNVARTPKRVWVDRVMHHVAEFLRRTGFDRFVWFVRKTGIPDLIRAHNTKPALERVPDYHAALAPLFRKDAAELMVYCDRDMVQEWHL